MSLRIPAGLSHRLKPALRAAMAGEKLRRVSWCSSPLQWGYVSGTVGLYRRACGSVAAVFAVRSDVDRNHRNKTAGNASERYGESI